MTALPLDGTLVVRRMELADLDQVQAIDRISFSLPWPASAYRYELKENPLSLLWVAELRQGDGQRRIAGVVVVWLILDEAHIATIAVHPEYRGQGIGRRLLASAVRDAIYRGAGLATLEVRASNLAAQNLYRRFRFEVVGSRPHYYKDNHEDALIMTVSGLGEADFEWLDRLV